MVSFNFGRALGGLSQGLLAAGGQGWGAFGPGMLQGQQLYDQQQQQAQQQKLQEISTQLAQQRLEDERTANTQAAAADKAWHDLLTGQGAPSGMASGAVPGDQLAQVPPGLRNGGPGGMPLGPGLMQGVQQGQGLFSQVPQSVLTMAANLPRDEGINLIAPFLKPNEADKPLVVGGVVIDPKDPKHILADYSDVLQRNAAAGRQTTNVMLPKVESSYQNKFGGAQGEKAALISTDADTARKQMDALSTIEALRGAAQAAGGDVGALAPIKLKVGSYLQALGMDPKEYDLGPTGILQAIDSAANKLALSGIGQGGLPANNFSEADRNFIVSTVPSLADTPEGFQLKSLVLKKANSRTLEKEALWNSGKYDQTTEAGYQKFLTDWSSYVQAHPLFNDQERRAADALKSGSKPTVVKTLDGPGWAP